MIAGTPLERRAQARDIRRLGDQAWSLRRDGGQRVDHRHQDEIVEIRFLPVQERALAERAVENGKVVAVRAWETPRAYAEYRGRP